MKIGFIPMNKITEIFSHELEDTLNDSFITIVPSRSENTVVISVAENFFTKDILELNLIQLWDF